MMLLPLIVTGLVLLAATGVVAPQVARHYADRRARPTSTAIEPDSDVVRVRENTELFLDNQLAMTRYTVLNSLQRTRDAAQAQIEADEKRLADFDSATNRRYADMPRSLQVLLAVLAGFWLVFTLVDTVLLARVGISMLPDLPLLGAAFGMVGAASVIGGSVLIKTIGSGWSDLAATQRRLRYVAAYGLLAIWLSAIAAVFGPQLAMGLHDEDLRSGQAAVAQLRAEADSAAASAAEANVAATEQAIDRDTNLAVVMALVLLTGEALLLTPATEALELRRRRQLDKGVAAARAQRSAVEDRTGQESDSFHARMATILDRAGLATVPALSALASRQRQHAALPAPDEPPAPTARRPPDGAGGPDAPIREVNPAPPEGPGIDVVNPPRPGGPPGAGYPPPPDGPRPPTVIVLTDVELDETQ